MSADDARWSCIGTGPRDELLRVAICVPDSPMRVILTRPIMPITEASETASVERAEATKDDAAPRLEGAPTPPVAVVSVSERRAEAAQLREVEGWSNKQIARHLGVHPSTVGRWFGTEAKEETS